MDIAYGRTTVVHDVSIEVPADGVAAVMGHNGAGRTTLLRAAVGLLPRVGPHPARRRGRDGAAARPAGPLRPGLRAAGQQSSGQLTTAENLQVVADGRSRGPALVDEALDLFPALKGLGRRAGLLSGGSASSWPSPAR
ncbi:ATP-binding cassette domain-containing protein [Pseudonocardia humida]|uniref:ATP-binding cassette domain-containing protein n=1 Tax=Pseudonocardia humida TaxID=2800819 RepID=UPI00207D5C38|nr:ATP-binding cassette domain-containing protein [Pseudonocardia humida]